MLNSSSKYLLIKSKMFTDLTPGLQFINNFDVTIICHLTFSGTYIGDTHDEGFLCLER